MKTIVCEYCGMEFKSLGYANHRAACRRKRVNKTIFVDLDGTEHEMKLIEKSKKK